MWEGKVCASNERFGNKDEREEFVEIEFLCTSTHSTKKNRLTLRARKTKKQNLLFFHFLVHLSCHVQVVASRAK